MQQNKYKFLLYFISFVILVTLAIQFYWNYKNYQAGKQQVISEVQASLDNALDAYYIDLAEKNTLRMDVRQGEDIVGNGTLDSILKKIDFHGKEGIKLENLNPKDFSEVKVLRGTGAQRRDTVKGKARFSQNLQVFENVTSLRKAEDSLSDLFNLASRVIVSITTDTLDITALNNYLDDQLNTRNLQVGYGYNFSNNTGDTQVYNEEIINGNTLQTQAKSAYLPRNSRFEFHFTNDTATILKRNLPGLLLSALLVAAVVACLFFLLKVIRKQKQLAEIKNDLISNITHEFKTPISTVKVALEGIENFNKENDPVKTRNYLQMSHLQLNKLETMVEKLLETATLDGNRLLLQKEPVAPAALLADLVERHKNVNSSKTFIYEPPLEERSVLADPFHLENALNNILDNAVKYGGEIIETRISFLEREVEIWIQDNGKNLTKAQADQIFDKFYRVPGGNVHNVKGFGIGLYYSKQIFEKHGGRVQVSLNGGTIFKIQMPYE